MNKNNTFKNGDKVKYAYGITFTFIGVDPFDDTYAYCVNPTLICMIQPELERLRVDRLPLDRLTLCKP